MRSPSLNPTTRLHTILLYVIRFLLQPAASPAGGARHSCREGRALEPHAPAEPDRLPAKTVRYRDGCITSTRCGWWIHTSWLCPN